MNLPGRGLVPGLLLLRGLGLRRRCRGQYRLGEIGPCCWNGWGARENAITPAPELDRIFIRTHCYFCDFVRWRWVSFECTWAGRLDQRLRTAFNLIFRVFRYPSSGFRPLRIAVSSCMTRNWLGRLGHRSLLLGCYAAAQRKRKRPR